MVGAYGTHVTPLPLQPSRSQTSRFILSKAGTTLPGAHVRQNVRIRMYRCEDQIREPSDCKLRHPASFPPTTPSCSLKGNCRQWVHLLANVCLARVFPCVLENNLGARDIGAQFACNDLLESQRIGNNMETLHIQWMGSATCSGVCRVIAGYPRHVANLTVPLRLHG